MARISRDKKYVMRFYGLGGPIAIAEIKIDASIQGGGLGGSAGQRKKALGKIGRAIARELKKGTKYAIPIPFEVEKIY